MNRLVVFFNDSDTEGTQEGGEWSYRDRDCEGTGVNVGAWWCVPVALYDRERESPSAKYRLVCPRCSFPLLVQSGVSPFLPFVASRQHFCIPCNTRRKLSNREELLCPSRQCPSRQ